MTLAFTRVDADLLALPMIMLRHTRPDVPDGLCYGRMDIPVAACFDASVVRILQDLPVVERIFTSPLRRCSVLADAIGTARGLRPVVDPRLREVDFGAWEGRFWSELPEPELSAWSADLLHARPHGGETIAELRARALAALADHATGRTLIVTHHGILKSARQHLDGESGWHSDTPYGAWFKVDPARFKAAA
jgi:alpha-ribazole phosphatase